MALDLSLVAIGVSIAGLVIAVVGLLPLYLDYFRRRKVTFILHRFEETIDRPILSNWSIRLLYPDKPIEECNICWNDTPLPWSDQKPNLTGKLIVIGGGGVVRVPIGHDNEDGQITVRDGKRTLRKKRFSDLPKVAP